MSVNLSSLQRKQFALKLDAEEKFIRQPGGKGQLDMYGWH